MAVNSSAIFLSLLMPNNHSSVPLLGGRLRLYDYWGNIISYQINSYLFIELKPKTTCIMTNYNIERLTHLTRHWTQCLMNCAWVTGTVRQTSEPVLTNEAQCCSDQKHFQGLSSSVLQRIIKRREVLGTTVGCPQVTSKGKKKNLNRKMYNKTTNRMLLWYTSVKEVVCFLLRMHYCCTILKS